MRRNKTALILEMVDEVLATSETRDGQATLRVSRLVFLLREMRHIVARFCAVTEPSKYVLPCGTCKATGRVHSPVPHVICKACTGTGDVFNPHPDAWAGPEVGRAEL